MGLPSASLKAKAKELGFDACGVAPVGTLGDLEYLQSWLQAGKAGDMAPWLGRDPEKRTDPTTLLSEARSLIVLGLNYHQPLPERRYRIASYALGKDYHDIIPPKLKEMDRWLQDQGGQQRTMVDTSSLLEKPAAVRAGIGWIGKSTMLLHRQLGTWLFLSEILTTLDFEKDQEEKDHCGSCTRCIDACPTGAIDAPYQLDASKCIAYLTIEHKGSIPIEFRKAVGDRVFGCEECLDVCPWNRWARETRESDLKAIPRPDLREMLAWSDQEFRNTFRGTPIFRLKRDRWLRNICVVLGNIGTQEDLPALKVACLDDSDLVSEHARWAVDQIRIRNGEE
ncbi:MAG: tRNA epoxyqueuosine(34) reductase QueG [Verrucomicrobiota bacterium]